MRKWLLAAALAIAGTQAGAFVYQFELSDPSHSFVFSGYLPVARNMAVPYIIDLAAAGGSGGEFKLSFGPGQVAIRTRAMKRNLIDVHIRSSSLIGSDPGDLLVLRDPQGGCGIGRASSNTLFTFTAPGHLVYSHTEPCQKDSYNVSGEVEFSQGTFAVFPVPASAGLLLSALAFLGLRRRRPKFS